MIIWVRNIIFIVFILSAIYVLLSTSGRLRQRKRLNTQYKAQSLETKNKANKDEFITQGMVKYDRSMRPKLFLFVFIIPIIVIGTLIYLAQHS